MQARIESFKKGVLSLLIAAPPVGDQGCDLSRSRLVRQIANDYKASKPCFALTLITAAPVRAATELASPRLLRPHLVRARRPGRWQIRPRRIVATVAGVSYEEAARLLDEAGSVRTAIVMSKGLVSKSEAESRLLAAKGQLRSCLAQLGNRSYPSLA
jgi:hypothetical protein